MMYFTINISLLLCVILILFIPIRYAVILCYPLPAATINHNTSLELHEYNHIAIY